MFEDNVLIELGLKHIFVERMNEHIKSQFRKCKHARDAIRKQYMFDALEACKPDIDSGANEMVNVVKSLPINERERKLAESVEATKKRISKRLFQIVRYWDDTIAECKR